MFAFVFRRLGLVVPTFLGVTLFAFVLIRLIPGDPVALLAGERGLTPERHAQMLAQLGLDRPMVEQYFSYLWSLAQGDFGRSLVTRSPVLNDFLTLFPATLELSFAAMIFAVAIGLPAGILAAVRRGSALDHTVMAGALTGYSMPIFWWGLLLIMLFSVTLGWTPVSGRISVMYYVEPVTGFMLIDTLLSDEPEAFWSALHHLVLPAIVPRLFGREAH